MTHRELQALAEALRPILRPLEIGVAGTWVEMTRPRFSNGFDAGALDLDAVSVVTTIADIAREELGSAWPFDSTSSPNDLLSVAVDQNDAELVVAFTQGGKVLRARAALAQERADRFR